MPDRSELDARRLELALILILLFMAGEVVVALVASSLALLSDAAHMLTDAAALALALLAARLASRPAKGAMTFGLGRAEVLSANANGLTMLVLSLLITYAAVRHLVAPAHVSGLPVLAVALAGIVVNLAVVRILGSGHEHHHKHEHHHGGGHRQQDPGGEHQHDERHRKRRSLNLEGSYRHIITDLFGFVVTALAAAVILLTQFRRADAIASLVIAASMLISSYGLIRASLRVMMEAAPEGVDPDAVGLALAAQSGVSEVHDLHVWEVTSGFAAVSAHVVVDAGHDCHAVRRALALLLRERFGLSHSTLQVEHARAEQPPMQIEVSDHPLGR